jgi:transcription antitermination factor NusG
MSIFPTEHVETPLPVSSAECFSPQWYAIQTRPRHEKVVGQRLQEQAVETFLPVITQIHRWSDRRKAVQVPLFPGYAFVCIPYSAPDRIRVLRTDGVIGFVGTRQGGTPIPEKQIEDIRLLLRSGEVAGSYPFIKVGQRIRIRGGALDGVCGILVAKDGDRTLVISVEPIQRSLAIRIQGYDVEPC